MSTAGTLRLASVRCESFEEFHQAASVGQAVDLSVMKPILFPSNAGPGMAAGG
jgi:hypothetical protein